MPVFHLSLFGTYPVSLTRAYVLAILLYMTIHSRLISVSIAIGLIIPCVCAQTPTPIVPVGKVSNFTSAHKISLFGNYAYLADRDEGVAVVDISDITAPNLLLYLTRPAGSSNGDWVDEIAVGEGILAVADHDKDRLYFYSLDDPSEPERVGPVRYSSVSPHAGLLFQDGYLWISGGDNRLEVYRTSDLDSIFKTFSLRTHSLDIAFDIAPGPSGFYLSALKSEGGYYVVPFDTDKFNREDDFQLRRRSDVSVPYWPNYYLDCAVRDNILYSVAYNRLTIMSATHPADLEALGHVILSGRNLRYIALQEEGYAFVSHVSGAGITVVDVRDPESNVDGIPDPSIVARLSPLSSIGEMALRGRLLYCAGTGGAGLQIYDIGPHLLAPVSPTPTPSPTSTNTPTSTPTPSSADLNRDGVVDEIDIFILLEEMKESL
jgi:hypothetical protein